MGHRGGFNFEAFHSHRCLEIAEFYFDLPPLHVEVGDFFGWVLQRVKEVGDHDEGCFFARSIFITHLDISQGHFVGKLRPLLGGEFTGSGLARRFTPGDEAFYGSDFFALAPIKFAVAGLVQAHEGVAFSLGHDPANVFVGAEGPVTEYEVSFVDVFEEARGDAGIVLLEAAGFKSFDPAVAEVDHSDDAHDWKAAAFFLAAVLAVDGLFFFGVNEGHTCSVDGLEFMPAPSVSVLNSALKGLLNTGVNLDQKLILNAASGTTVSAAIAPRNRQIGSAGPSLNHAQGLGAAGVRFQDLTKPCPKYGEVPKVAFTFGGIDRGEKGGREHALKNESVAAAAKRVFDKEPSSRLNRSLRAALGGGKDGVRKAGEDGLFGHAFKPYPNRLFV